MSSKKIFPGGVSQSQEPVTMNNDMSKMKQMGAQSDQEDLDTKRPMMGKDAIIQNTDPT